MNRIAVFFACSAGAFLAVPAHADLDIRFVEGAPKDSFEIVNSGGCPTGPVVVVVDLTETAGKLIFDTTETGAGVEVYQPFELVRGQDIVDAATIPTDGARSVTLTFSTIAPKQSAKFTIDVDDTLTFSDLGQIRVSGAEIEGGRVAVSVDGAPERLGFFDGTGRASVPLATCTS